MYLFSVQPYLDLHNNCYKNVITINIFPRGPLCRLIRRIYPPKLSPFKVNTPCCPNRICILALCSIREQCKLMCLDELPELLTYLEINHYEIDHNITNIMLKSDVKLKNNILFFARHKYVLENAYCDDIFK